MAFAKKRALHDSMLSMIKNAVKTTTGMPRCRDKAATGETETTVWTQCEYQKMFKEGEDTHTKTHRAQKDGDDEGDGGRWALNRTEARNDGGSPACWPGECTQNRSVP